jgi:hypothetical protein
MKTTWILTTLGLCAFFAVGCGMPAKKKEPPKPKYATQPLREVPPWLEKSIFQYADLGGTQPYIVQGFGLVVNCDAVANSKIEPGSQRYPTAVREYMLREMQKRGVGSVNNVVGDKFSPSKMLADPKNSIVIVRSLIPPGARKESSVDIEVAAIPGSTIQSLARGELYECDLAERGGDYRAPGSAIHIVAKARGPVFVNPALAIDASRGTKASRSSLQQGMVMDGGSVTIDRPLILQLRVPQRSLARQIEYRIDAAFQDMNAAAAQDEGLVYVYVPKKYQNDWQHFAGVMTHLFLDERESFVVRKATELAKVAKEDPKAPLMDISYCWEGLGPKAIGVIEKLITDENPDIAFAAARAAAYLGHIPAQDALVKMAQTRGHKFQVNAVSVLGSLPDSPAINDKIRPLLDSTETLVRIEAYHMLTRQRDPFIKTRVVAKDNEKFVLDIITSKGPPLIYATRTGMPRIALFGAQPRLKLPITWAALDNRLTISSDDKEKFVDIFYRGTEFREPVRVLSNPHLDEIIARLGGDGAIEDAKLNFGYGDVVGMLQSLTESRKVVVSHNGKEVYPTFLLQEIQVRPDEIRSAPLLPGQDRPRPERSGATSSSQ